MYTLRIKHSAALLAISFCFAFTMTHALTENEAALIAAAQSGNFKRLKELAQKQTNLNVTDEQGATPLHYAARQGDDYPIRYLIYRGAKVSAQDKQGKTPLDWATKESAKNLLKLHAGTRTR